MGVATTTTCRGGSVCGRARCGRCGAQEGKRGGWGGAAAHGDHVEADGAVGDESMRRQRRKGSPVMLGEDEVEEDVAEGVSVWGSTARRSRRWRRGWTRWCNTGTTVDAVSRWREHGSIGHGGGRAMERDQGESAVSARLGDAREFIPRGQVDEGSGEAAAAAWRACGARRRAPACLAKPSCSLAGWLG